ncbi:aromatic ring-hydroxylating dioxygenase subunit alpha [Paraburkholderia sp. USG1]|uniref:aromatic ring-hydroxylating oxygenase subunit alpha n=1 Tax=Paraburkholderia sp. USG1 TaxID=2952268 RepID=UPI002858BECB|nr:aromatic ring-hydroxylating dioxygenase subunit alpha [Paraburkholderia sp. USG1]MDR8398326.1 aromatic ring-hydroxylating dioxygenase subunit alpha [Paraburkholderia sp. USG1]
MSSIDKTIPIVPHQPAVARRTAAEVQAQLVNPALRQGPEGVYLGARNIYTDPDLFELEMRHLFEGNWVYAAHVSQLPNVNDFFTLTVGRQPVLLTRDQDGEVRGFLNVCAHRGARVCREKVGSRKIHMCQFHGWCYNARGELVNVTDEAKGGYPSGFDRSHLGLTPVAKLEIYRGFIFVSLSAEVPSLKEYLAGAALFIDLVADQSPSGNLEVLPGETAYTFSGNWKLAAENGLDGYHVGTVHGNYIMTTKRRAKNAVTDTTKNLDVSNWGEGDSGFFAFDNGHGVLYAPYANYQDRPAYALHERYVERFGSEYADWITKKVRNLLLMPNVFLMDQMSSQIRILRPVSVDVTEVISYCIAPVDESPDMRERRIRQFEDFFNATGMATPDDLTEFRNCQIGYRAGNAPWNDLSRGQTRWVHGANDSGRRLGVNALSSGTEAADEGVFITILEEWKRRMQDSISRELAGGE